MVVGMGIFMFGALGLAIDGGQMYAQWQMAQAAADAAAEAGIMSILKGTNATSTYTFATGTPPLASYVCTTTDGRTPCVYARDNGFGATASDTVTLSYPATVSGVTLTSVTVPAFTVTVQRILQTGMIRFVGGPATSTISAKAISRNHGQGFVLLYLRSQYIGVRRVFGHQRRLGRRQRLRYRREFKQQQRPYRNRIDRHRIGNRRSWQDRHKQWR